MELALVTRRGCHLCDEALALVRSLGLEPSLLDVDSDPALSDLYDFRVPVLLAADRLLAEGKLEHSTLARALGLPPVRIASCGPEAAETVHRLTQEAFGPYGSLDPPSGAVREDRGAVVEELAAHGGALAELGGVPAGCLRLRPDGNHLLVRRLAIDPRFQGQGIGRAMMAWAESEARRRGLEGVSVGVRLALPGNLDFYRRLGYRQVSEHMHPGYNRPTWVSMQKGIASRPDPG